MNTSEVLQKAKEHLIQLEGRRFGVLEVTKPVSPDAAVNLAKIISKLSPLVGNLIEFNTVEVLNDVEDFKSIGTWKRQDPGFPDAVFISSLNPTPGMEIKAWFPLATEITARFRDSQNHFINENIDVALIAWLPEYLIYGQPVILGACIVSGLSVAKARDNHYHRPPDYLVLEPNDTTARTRNLQQSNTAGYKWQGTPEQFQEAQQFMQQWGENYLNYNSSAEYQQKLTTLMGRYRYRLDTNFSKIDRIRHQDIEAFKAKIYQQKFCGMAVRDWMKILASENDILIEQALLTHLSIGDIDANLIVD